MNPAAISAVALLAVSYLPAQAQTSFGTRSGSFGECGVQTTRAAAECEGDAMFSNNCTCLVMKNTCGFSVMVSYKLSTEPQPRSTNIPANDTARRCTPNRSVTIQYLEWKRAP
jgi:hypothetical protein